MQRFGGQEPRYAANAGRDALPYVGAVTACFASRTKAQTVGRVSAGVSAHPRGAACCSIGEVSFGLGRHASGAFVSILWRVRQAADW